MINTSTVLYHVQPYDGQLPITTVGDVSSTFTDVFLAHKHATNLIFVGQLVDDNFDVYFFVTGCVVQDQVMGKPIVRGLKVGRLFPLFLPVPAFSSINFFTCNKIPTLGMV